MLTFLVCAILYVAIGFGTLAAIGAATSYAQPDPSTGALILAAAALWPLTIPVVVFALIGTAVGDYLRTH